MKGCEVFLVLWPMKSSKRTASRKSVDAVMAYVDSEIAKIVETVVAARNAKRAAAKRRRTHAAHHAA